MDSKARKGTLDRLVHRVLKGMTAHRVSPHKAIKDPRAIKVGKVSRVMRGMMVIKDRRVIKAGRV